MTECLVSAEESEVLLPIENLQGVTVYLDAGMQLGSVQALPSPLLEPKGTPESDCASSSTSTVRPLRILQNVCQL